MRAPRSIATTAVLALLAGVMLVVGPTANTAQAANAADFNPGYIISDEVFFNQGAMSEAQIQAFLVAKVPNCVGGRGAPCLKSWVGPSSDKPGKAGHCSAIAGRASETASSVIYRVAQACRINPQVLLVTLQKEQGLVTQASPSEGQFKIAMGFGCPDTAPCDTAYYGFFNQIYKAAWQFRQYTYDPKGWRYRIGAIPVQWHPNSGCGAPVVQIANQATANLYNYTPYQPNAAALANLAGTGDACSSYGNRNFWRFFTDWFGPTTGPVSPFGNVEIVSSGIGAVRVAGWAIDPSSRESIAMHVYVGGVGHAIPANLPRTDVEAHYPNYGASHGFDVQLPARGGSQQVCVYGMNVGPGANSLLGCWPVEVPTGSPIGVLAASASGNDITASGWAIDPDTKNPIRVHVYANALGVGTMADLRRDDVAAYFPAYGALHGFSTGVTVPDGQYQVCAYGINVDGGGNSSLGCVQVTVGPPGSALSEQGRAPSGRLDSASFGPGGITASGWALDADVAVSIPVHVYVGAVGASVMADGARPDLATHFPEHGIQHGFSRLVMAPPGQHNVCAYAINTGAGGNSSLGCSIVTVPSSTPFGNVEQVTGGVGSVNVSGWAINRLSVTPVPIHIYVGAAGFAVPAGGIRSDVGAAYPSYGANHGFAASIPAATGTHRVCIYAIDEYYSSNQLMRCTNVVVQ